jgi:hypothetical protein
MDGPVSDEPTTRVDRAATNGALIAVGSPISEKALATRAVANCPIGYGHMLQPSSSPLHLGQPLRPIARARRRTGPLGWRSMTETRFSLSSRPDRFCAVSLF